MWIGKEYSQNLKDIELFKTEKEELNSNLEFYKKEADELKTKLAGVYENQGEEFKKILA